jgi:hypothetical protein
MFMGVDLESLNYKREMESAREREREGNVECPSLPADIPYPNFYLD